MRSGWGVSLTTELGGGIPWACHLQDLPVPLTLTPAVWWPARSWF